MKQCKKQRYVSIWMAWVLVAACLLSWGGASAIELDVKQDAAKAPQAASQTQVSDTAVRHSTFEDLGVDLVVSKVVMERGEFNQGRTVKVTPYVKNMCNGILGGNIKVSLPEFETAVWIRTGIGPKEEKSAGSLYYCELSQCDLGPFSVVVDSDNEIKENNESNNRCTGITFGSAETNKTHRCSIQGPHCHDAPDPGKHRIRDPEIR